MCLLGGGKGFLSTDGRSDRDSVPSSCWDHDAHPLLRTDLVECGGDIVGAGTAGLDGEAMLGYCVGSGVVCY